MEPNPFASFFPGLGGPRISAGTERAIKRQRALEEKRRTAKDRRIRALELRLEREKRHKQEVQARREAKREKELSDEDVIRIFQARGRALGAPARPFENPEMLVENPRVGSVVPWVVLAGALFVGYKVISAEIPTLLGKIQGSPGITSVPSLNYSLGAYIPPPQGAGIDLNALAACPAGNYFVGNYNVNGTPANQCLTIDQIRNVLLGANVANASSMTAAQLVNQYQATFGGYVIPA